MANDALPISTILDGRYEIQERLGSGGFGQVYRALDLRSGREVALKVMRTDVNHPPEVLERWFRREVEVLRRFRHHPHIVHIVESRLPNRDGLFYYVMEFLPQRLADMDPPPAPGEMLRYADQIAQALQSLHEAGYIHRDVREENILLHPQRGAVLVDFGTVQRIGEEEGWAVRNRWAPWEQTEGHPEPRSDQAALARMLLHHLGQNGLPPPLQGCLQRAAAEHVEERFPSMAEFRDALREACPFLRRRFRPRASIREGLCLGWGSHFQAPWVPLWLALHLAALVLLSPFWLLAWRRGLAMPTHPALLLLTLLWLAAWGYRTLQAGWEAEASRRPGEEQLKGREVALALGLLGGAVLTLRVTLPNPLQPGDDWRAGLVWPALLGTWLGPGSGGLVAAVAAGLASPGDWPVRLYMAFALGSTANLCGLLWRRGFYDGSALAIGFALLAHVLQYDLQHPSASGSGKLLAMLLARLRRPPFYEDWLWLALAALGSGMLGRFLQGWLGEGRSPKEVVREITLHEEVCLAGVILLGLGVRPWLTGARWLLPEDWAWWGAAWVVSLWPWLGGARGNESPLRRQLGLMGGPLWLSYFLLEGGEPLREALYRAFLFLLLLGAAWCASSPWPALWSLLGAVAVWAGRLEWMSLPFIAPVAFLAQGNLRRWGREDWRAWPLLKALLWLVLAWGIYERLGGTRGWRW